MSESANESIREAHRREAMRGAVRDQHGRFVSWRASPDLSHLFVSSNAAYDDDDCVFTPANLEALITGLQRARRAMEGE